MNKPSVFMIAVLISVPISSLAQSQPGKIVDLPGFAFKYSVETSAAESTIWGLWTDVENWKDFDVLLEYSYLEQGAVFNEGAQGYLKAQGAPRVSFEIGEFMDRQSFAVKLKIPLFQTIQQRRYFETAAGGKTVFTHEIKFEGGLSPLVYLFLGRIYKRETQAVMENIRILAETGRRD